MLFGSSALNERNEKVTTILLGSNGRELKCSRTFVNEYGEPLIATENVRLIMGNDNRWNSVALAGGYNCRRICTGSPRFTDFNIEIA